MLPSRIQVHDYHDDGDGDDSDGSRDGGDDSDAASVEGIFASALTTIFPDDAVNAHGTPGARLTYRSRTLGRLRLHVPPYPHADTDRRLFAHQQWNAGVVAAEAIEAASTTMTSAGVWDRRFWDVRGRNVLELGAGTALPSIVGARCHAASVTITDHPSSPALAGGSIEQSVRVNLDPGIGSRVSIQPYVWGSSVRRPTWQHALDRIIVADCLWLPSQHVNLIKTLVDLLPASPAAAASTTPCALVVAGFHTGRRVVANFVALATDPGACQPARRTARPRDPAWQSPDAASTAQPTPPPAAAADLEVERAYVGKLRAASLFEVDVNLNTRPWAAERPGESQTEAKRWCMVAVLVRREN